MLTDTLSKERRVGTMRNTRHRVAVNNINTSGHLSLAVETFERVIPS